MLSKKDTFRSKALEETIETWDSDRSQSLKDLSVKHSDLSVRAQNEIDELVNRLFPQLGDDPYRTLSGNTGASQSCLSDTIPSGGVVRLL